jgi:hypothetical protein
MNAPEAEAAYHEAKSQLDAGQISLDEYNRKVAALHYMDNTGMWWAINPADGAWLCWNGSAWEQAFESRALSLERKRDLPSSDIPATRQGQSAGIGGAISASGVPAVDRPPWPNGKKFAAGSIACGIISFVVFPYIFGITGIFLGIAAIREKYTPGAFGVVVSVAVIAASYLPS